MEAAAVTHTIAKVGLALPQFWTETPELWFITVESNFDLVGIKQDITKYNHVVAKLEPEVLRVVRDIVTSPPTTDRYETLKSALLTRLSDSESQKLRRLLTDIQLGDRKPSQLLRDMKELAKNNITDDALKSLWLQRLPTQVQAVLSISKDGLSDLATMADSICDVLQPTAVCSIQSPPRPRSAFFTDPAFLAMQQQIAKLQKTVATIALSATRSSRNRNHSRQIDNGNRKLGKPSIKAVLDGNLPTRPTCVHLTDLTSGTRFLVDTGAAVSVLPASPSDRRLGVKCPSLYTASGSPIPTYGTKLIQVNVGLRRSMTNTLKCNEHLRDGVLTCVHLELSLSSHMGLNSNVLVM